MPSFFLSIVTLIFATSVFAADAKPDALTIKVCKRMGVVMKPKGISTDGCYIQAKTYLKEHVKESELKQKEGSYEAYFELAEKDQTQKICYSFLKEIVTSTQEFELEDAKALYENDKAQSLDQSFYSYQACADMDKKAKAAAAATSTTPTVKSQGTTQ